MCAAQDPTKLKGKILRLDVSQLPAGAGVAPRALVAAPGNPFATSPDSNARLVWEFGLRNPVRFPVDAATGQVWVSDVGQNELEELDHSAARWVCLGWPHREAAG